MVECPPPPGADPSPGDCRSRDSCMDLGVAVAGFPGPGASRGLLGLLCVVSVPLPFDLLLGEAAGECLSMVPAARNSVLLYFKMFSMPIMLNTLHLNGSWIHAFDGMQSPLYFGLQACRLLVRQSSATQENPNELHVACAPHPPPGA